MPFPFLFPLLKIINWGSGLWQISDSESRYQFPTRASLLHAIPKGWAWGRLCLLRACTELSFLDLFWAKLLSVLIHAWWIPTIKTLDVSMRSNFDKYISLILAEAYFQRNFSEGLGVSMVMHMRIFIIRMHPAKKHLGTKSKSWFGAMFVTEEIQLLITNCKDAFATVAKVAKVVD